MPESVVAVSVAVSAALSDEPVSTAPVSKEPESIDPESNPESSGPVSVLTPSSPQPATTNPTAKIKALILGPSTITIVHSTRKTPRRSSVALM
jgi:hypothetical protein